MIVYADSCAVVKLYVEEAGSSDTREFLGAAEVVGTSLITRAEVAAAISMKTRLGGVDPAGAAAGLQRLREEWPDFARVPITEELVAEADRIACAHDARGFDAVHLAAALSLQDAAGGVRTFVTFDARLWRAAKNLGLAVWPVEMAAYHRGA